MIKVSVSFACSKHFIVYVFGLVRKRISYNCYFDYVSYSLNIVCWWSSVFVDLFLQVLKLTHYYLYAYLFTISSHRDFYTR